MKIPSTIKIGAHRVKIVLGQVNDDECANYDRDSGVITICENLPQTQKEVAFIHEIFHVMNSVLDHTLLDSLSEQIYQVLKDNNLLK
jgi:hypothetical protein